jgi:hypothetical protein
MVYHTSGFTAQMIRHTLNRRKGCVVHAGTARLRPAAAALNSLIPDSVGNVVCREAFPAQPHDFAAVDASLIFISRTLGHQDQSYSGKFRPCFVKVQIMATPDRQYVTYGVTNKERRMTG